MSTWNQGQKKKGMKRENEEDAEYMEYPGSFFVCMSLSMRKLIGPGLHAEAAGDKKPMKAAPIWWGLRWFAISSMPKAKNVKWGRDRRMNEAQIWRYKNRSWVSLTGSFKRLINKRSQTAHRGQGADIASKERGHTDDWLCRSPESRKRTFSWSRVLAPRTIGCWWMLKEWCCSASLTAASFPVSMIKEGGKRWA